MSGAASTTTTTALVVFRVGDRSCALPAERVARVVHLPELARPPAGPPLLEGFLLCADGVVPVVRSARVLGLGETATGLYTPLLLLAGGAGPLALLVDAVDAVVHLDDGALRPVVPAATLNGCVAGQWRRQGATVHLLDADRLLLRQEEERLRQLAEQVRRRLGDLPGGEA